MKNKILSKKILILPLLLIVALVVLIYFALSDIKARNEHTSELLSEFSSQSSQQQYVLSLQKTVQNADSDIARLNNSIIPSDGDVTFIENLEAAARTDGLAIDINSLGFDDTLASSTSITVFKIDAKTSGPWLGTYTFLAQMESLPFKIKINNFSFLSTLDTISTNGKISSKALPVWQSSFEILVLKYK